MILDRIAQNCLILWIMDMNPYQSPSADPLGTNTASRTGVTPRTVSELVGTKPWVRFISVLLFIGAGMIMLGGLAVSIAMMSQVGVAAVLAGGLYAVFGLLYLIPALKLWKYGSAITQLQFSNSSGDLEEAMSQQRSFWKFIGIMTIVGFVVGILAAVGMAAFGVNMASQGVDFPLDMESMEQPNFELE